MAKSQREKIITGLAGEFLVAGHLSLKGYVASLTIKNYPEVDIFCLNPQNGKQCTIQVKTKRGGRLYYVPEKVDDSETPFVFVYINKDDSYDFFIISAKDVAFLSAKQRQYYIESHPNVKKQQSRMLSVESIQPYKNQWDLLGLKD